MPIATESRHQEPTFEVSFDQSELPDTFVHELAQAYLGPQDERIRAMEALLVKTTVEQPFGGRVSMLDAVWEAATTPPTEEHPDDKRPRGDRIVVQINPDGEIKGVLRASETPIDLTEQGRTMHTAKMQAWGPHNNRAAMGHNHNPARGAHRIHSR